MTSSAINIRPAYLVPVKPDPDQEFLTVQQAAWMMQVSVPSVYKWIKEKDQRKRLKAHRAGGQWRIKRNGGNSDTYKLTRLSDRVEGPRFAAA